MKWCHRCQAAKPIAEFGVNRARRDGLTVYCIECGRAATAESRRKLRGDAVASLGGRCVECGYDKDSRALQFDHVNGDGHAERRPGGLGSGPKFLRAVIAGTLAGRVQLLCANCYAIKVFEANERGRNRQYQREIPTERIDRPSRRWTPEQRAAQAAKSAAMWADPERRAAIVAAQVEAGRDPAIREIRSRAGTKGMRSRWGDRAADTSPT